MQQQREHAEGHSCNCQPSRPLLWLTTKAGANAGRDFYVCANKQQNDPNTGCDLKFCWADEYPNGFYKKKSFGGASGGGRGRGGFGGAPARGGYQPQAPRTQYAGFANAPQPQQVPQPDFPNKRPRTDSPSPAPVAVEAINELGGNLESLRAELTAQITELRELLVTMANDIVGAIKSAAADVEEMNV